MRVLLVGVAVAAALSAPQSAPQRHSVTTSKGDHVILTVTVEDAGATKAVTAMVVRVDGRENQHVVLTPGVGRSTYTALLGPLDAGVHEIQLVPSPYWPADPGVRIRDVASRVVRPEDSAFALLQYAPSLGLRADTIGTASDLPLVMYVEDLRQNGEGWVRYSVIFSHEDGGTVSPALMARWGRTTDIEFVYEIEWRSGRVVQERIQAPDHKVLPFNGAREGSHPYLLVATLNNMVIDRGLSVAAVRPAPVAVNLATATRESVMDAHPWIYKIMARELTLEGRIGTQVRDPAEYLYVEAELQLENAAVAVVVTAPDGPSDSTTGNEQWAVDRNGWVRMAVRAPVNATSLQWRCIARKKSPGDASRCSIDLTRAFRLTNTYLPGPNLVQPRSIRLSDGVSDAVRLNTASPQVPPDPLVRCRSLLMSPTISISPQSRHMTALVMTSPVWRVMNLDACGRNDRRTAE